MVWTRFICHKIGTSGGLLFSEPMISRQCMTFLEDLLFSQDRLCCLESVGTLKLKCVVTCYINLKSEQKH
jgi:hypothetical protein